MCMLKTHLLDMCSSTGVKPCILSIHVGIWCLGWWLYMKWLSCFGTLDTSSFVILGFYIITCSMLFLDIHNFLGLIITRGCCVVLGVLCISYWIFVVFDIGNNWKSDNNCPFPNCISRVCAPHEYVFVLNNNKFILTSSIYLDKSVFDTLNLNLGAELIELPFDTSVSGRLIIYEYKSLAKAQFKIWFFGDPVKDSASATTAWFPFNAQN